jgi:pimeloyl-ACP methyl ester carboxylesterase
VAASLVAASGPSLAEVRYQTVIGEGGVPLNVASAGNPAKPALLLVHGIGQSHVSFEQQLQSSLTDDFHLVAFDLRGHGNSGKPWAAEAYKDAANWAGDVRRVMEALGLQRPVILGWSYGTLVVADYLRKSGSANLAGIVLTGAYGGLTPPPPIDPAFAERFAGNRRLQLSANPADNVTAALATASMLTARDMGEPWRVRAAGIAMMLPAYARTQMFDRPLANLDLLPALDVPLMLVIGGKDGSTPEPQARDLATQLESRGTRVVISVYPEAGHSPFAEEPARFNQELARFIREVQPP